MVLTATGTTDLLWKKRPKPLHGSRKFHEMFQALRPSFSGVWNPARQRVSSVFHSSGSIWPEPEVEMSWTALAGRLVPSKPACLSSSLALAGLYSYVSLGLPNHG